MTMTRYLLTAGPEGAAATTANTGANVVSTVNPSTVKFAAAMKGTSGAFGLAMTATNQTALVRLLADVSGTTVAFSYELTLPDAIPANADATLHTTIHSAGVVGRVKYRTTGSLVFADTTSVNNAVVPAANLTTGMKIRVEEQYVGGSTTAGIVKIQVYKQSDDSLLGSFNSGTMNLSVNPIIGGDFGNTGGITNALTFGFANVQIDSGRTTAIGKYVPGVNIPPTVAAGADKSVAFNSTVGLAGTATDSDGTIASTTWAFDSYPTSLGAAPTITNANTLAASFNAGAYGKYVVRLTAVDNSGASVSSVVTIYVASATSVTVVGLSENTGAWTQTGATSFTAALADSDPSTIIESPSSPDSPKTITFDLNPIQPTTGGTLKLTNTSYFGSGSLDVTVELISKGSGTIRKTWHPVTLGGDVNLALDSTSAAAIPTADWNNLQVRFTAVVI